MQVSFQLYVPTAAHEVWGWMCPRISLEILKKGKIAGSGMVKPAGFVTHFIVRHKIRHIIRFLKFTLLKIQFVSVRLWDDLWVVLNCLKRKMPNSFIFTKSFDVKLFWSLYIFNIHSFMKRNNGTTPTPPLSTSCVLLFQWDKIL